MSVQRINNCSKLDERNSGTEKSHYLIHGWSAAIAAWLAMAKRGNDLLKLIFIKARPMRGGSGRRQSTPARYHCLQSLYTYKYTQRREAKCAAVCFELRCPKVGTQRAICQKASAPLGSSHESTPFRCTHTHTHTKVKLSCTQTERDI